MFPYFTPLKTPEKQFFYGFLKGPKMGTLIFYTGITLVLNESDRFLYHIETIPLMDWFLYDSDLYHEKLNENLFKLCKCFIFWWMFKLGYC